MTPFLFLIVSEGLNGLLKKAVEIDKFRGFSFGGDEDVSVSMVQFSNDTLIIGEASQQNVLIIKCILRCFEMVSGLKVNFFKSKLMGIAVEGNTLSNFASSIHCRTSCVPFKYLGVMVGGNPRKTSFWDSVINKVQKRLAL